MVVGRETKAKTQIAINFEEMNTYDRDRRKDRSIVNVTPLNVFSELGFVCALVY